MSSSLDRRCGPVRRKGVCAGLVLALLAAPAGRAAAQTANPPPGWMAELPSVDKVKASIPAGRDAKETLMRQTAACEVLEDLIQLFTGKTDFDLYRTQQPPEAYARFREYRGQSESYRGGPKFEVSVLAASKTFREEALAKMVPPAMQRAYWEVRSVTMAATERRRETAKAIVANVSVALPTVDRVATDMKGEIPRDTDQRTVVALNILYNFASKIPGQMPKAQDYSAAAQRLRTKWPPLCKDEPGCDEAVTSTSSRASWCLWAYQHSAGFARWVLNQYPLPPAALDDIAKSDPILAIELKAQPIKTAPLRACTTLGQFPESRELTAAAAGGDLSKWHPQSDLDRESKDQLAALLAPSLTALSGLLSLAASPGGMDKPMDFPDVKPDPAVAIAKGAGVDMNILGAIPLGAPMRSITPCASDDLPKGKTCVVPPKMATALTVGTAGGIAPPAGGVFLRNPDMKTFNWVKVVYGDVRDGVLTRVGVSTTAEGALSYLKRKYGAPVKTTPLIEWSKPGLHIAYSRPALDGVPSAPGRAPTHKCVPGTDCDATDEMKADFWSAVPGFIGAGVAMKAATAPNLVFEVQAKQEIAP